MHHHHEAVAMRPMPAYRSHKTVYALKIKTVTRQFASTDPECIGDPIRYLIGFENEEYGPLMFTPDELLRKPLPQEGWYYVQYGDGYFSFSPAKQFEEGYVPELEIIERAARGAHEANRILCQTIEDYSQPSWDNAPEWQKKSAIEGVFNLLLDPNMTPEQSHANWMRHKEADGWRYGPAKRPEVREHPCMVPYEQLPREQQLKDHLYGVVVRAALGISA